MAKPLFGWALMMVLPVVASAVTMEMVTVGDPGNPADPSDGSPFDPGIQNYGSVGYTYNIGMYEVMNSQYAEFLNSVAAVGDAYGLYNSSMDSDPVGGIIRTGAGTIGDPYAYSTKANMANKPVNYVSFYDAVRFVNWLENGQPTGVEGAGTTETGSYTLFTSGSSTTNVGARIGEASWVIPTEDEWYKAAFYDPSVSGPTDDYWSVATRSDIGPSEASADAMGNISNPGANVANHNWGADWNGQDGNVTTVGSAGPLSASYFGTFDQAGNVWEWNETQFGSTRGVRGGAWYGLDAGLFSSGHYSNYPWFEDNTHGFRVAMIPEPGTFVAMALAGLAACVWCRRRR